MTTEQDINKQVQKEYDKLRDKIYDGPELPAGVTEIFRKGIMMVPPSSHRFNFIKVKELLGKDEKQLSWLEVGMIINFIGELVPEKFFNTPEEVADFYITLSDIVAEYNKVTSGWQRHIEGIKQRLMSTSGIVREKPKKLISL